MPVPIFIRDYLSKAFYDMANGKSPYIALSDTLNGTSVALYFDLRKIIKS